MNEETQSEILKQLLVKHNIDVTKATLHISNNRLLDFIDDLLRRTREETE